MGKKKLQPGDNPNMMPLGSNRMMMMQSPVSNPSPTGTQHVQTPASNNDTDDLPGAISAPVSGGYVEQSVDYDNATVAEYNMIPTEESAEEVSEDMSGEVEADVLDPYAQQMGSGPMGGGHMMMPPYGIRPPILRRPPRYPMPPMIGRPPFGRGDRGFPPPRGPPRYGPPPPHFMGRYSDAVDDPTAANTFHSPPPLMSLKVRHHGPPPMTMDMYGTGQEYMVPPGTAPLQPPGTSPETATQESGVATLIGETPLTDVWVETTAADDRVYYYNAISRQAVWTKPETGKIISQADIDKMTGRANEGLTGIPGQGVPGEQLGGVAEAVQPTADGVNEGDVMSGYTEEQQTQMYHQQMASQYMMANNQHMMAPQVMNPAGMGGDGGAGAVPGDSSMMMLGAQEGQMMGQTMMMPPQMMGQGGEMMEQSVPVNNEVSHVVDPSAGDVNHAQYSGVDTQTPSSVQTTEQPLDYQGAVPNLGFAPQLDPTGMQYTVGGAVTSTAAGGEALADTDQQSGTVPMSGAVSHNVPPPGFETHAWAQMGPVAGNMDQQTAPADGSGSGPGPEEEAHIQQQLVEGDSTADNIPLQQLPSSTAAMMMNQHLLPSPLPVSQQQQQQQQQQQAHMMSLNPMMTRAAFGGQMMTPPGMAQIQMMGMPPMAGHPMMRMPGFMPPGMMTPGMMGAHMTQPTGCDWTEHRAPDGRMYYHNSKTMKSTWVKPQEMIEAEMMAGEQSVVGEFGGQQQDQEPGMDDDSMQQMIQQHNTESDKPPQQMETHRDSVEPVESKESAAKSAAGNKSRPIATKPIPGTPWCVVWTGDDRVFFFNPTTRLSLWEKPPEMKDRVDIDRLIANPPHKPKPAPSKETLETGPRDGSPAADEDLADTDKQSDEPAAKKLRTEPPALSEKQAAIEAEVKAARERAIVPIETRMTQFREMLVEKGVSAFATWDSELPKIVFDSRYLLLTTKERKMVFESFVKTRAEDERKEKKTKLKEIRDEFTKLLEEAKVNTRTTFSEFAQKFARDPRFKSVEKMRDRETIFNEFQEDLKRQDREKSERKAEKIRTDFFELLTEQKGISRHSSWTKVRSIVETDIRYKTVDSVSQREEWFREHIDRKIQEEKSVEDRENERMARIQQSLRERELEVQKTRSEQLKDWGREKEQYKREEAVQHFKALLTDMVRNTDNSWRETRRNLRKDKRWDLADLLGKEEKESLFNDHLADLKRKKKDMFRDLLKETTEITFNSTWRETRKMIKEDSRYIKFSSSETKKEREFDEWKHEKYLQAKAEFRELLKETKQITHKSKRKLDDSEQSLKEIRKVLLNDKRYLVLESVPDERQNILMAYIDELHRKGPPPPPTASEPSRRPAKM